MRIGLDFDGVLHSYVSGWTGETPTDPPVEGALEFVEWALSAGHSLFVFTSRAKDEAGRQGAEAWMASHGFPRLKVTYQKEHADLYVDDRAARFSGRWEPIRTIINTPGLAEPWNKEKK